MRKTAKSQLLHEFETSLKSSSNLDGDSKSSGSVLDFMAVVQSMNWTGICTFGEMATKLGNTIISALNDSSFLAVVPDRYDLKTSIKGEERSRRNHGGHSQEILIKSDSQKLPRDVPHNLKKPQNKTNLIKYTFGKWKSSFAAKLTESQVVYLANADGTTTEVKKSAVTSYSCLITKKLIARCWCAVSTCFDIHSED